MGKFTRKGSLALTAALAVVLAGASGASATPEADALAPVPTVGKDTVTRIGGADRIETAIEASKALYENAENSAYAEVEGASVVIARSDEFPDALAAATLADALDAPLLVTPAGKDLDERVAVELRRLKAGDVYIVGGTGAVSTAAQKTIDANSGAVKRLAGVDRYDTAVKVAEEVTDGVDKADVAVFLADGTQFPDALAAGAAAAATTNGVVLLTKGAAFDASTSRAWGQQEATGFTLDYLFDVTDGKSAYAAGNITAVGGPAAAAIGSGSAGAKKVTKVVGDDRYETASKLAAGISTLQFALASGANAADAVVASAYIANRDGALLLTRPDSLPAVTQKFLAATIADGENEAVTIFGGTGAIAASVEADVKNALVEASDKTAPVVTGVVVANNKLTAKTEPGAKVTLTASTTSAVPGGITALSTAGPDGTISYDLSKATDFTNNQEFKTGDLYLAVEDVPAGNVTYVNVPGFKVSVVAESALTVQGVDDNAAVLPGDDRSITVAAPTGATLTATVVDGDDKETKLTVGYVAGNQYKVALPKALAVEGNVVTVTATIANAQVSIADSDVVTVTDGL